MTFITTDETEPLLVRRDSLDSDLEEALARTHAKDDLELDFDPNGDPENPREWSTGYKWTITLIVTFMAFTV